MFNTTQHMRSTTILHHNYTLLSYPSPFFIPYPSHALAADRSISPLSSRVVHNPPLARKKTPAYKGTAHKGPSTDRQNKGETGPTRRISITVQEIALGHQKIRRDIHTRSTSTTEKWQLSPRPSPIVYLRCPIFCLQLDAFSISLNVPSSVVCLMRPPDLACSWA